MQVFEFHFNPKQKADLISNAFCFEPQNIYEKRLGSLYLAGTLKNALPQNLHLLDRLSQTIKERYYKNSLLNPAKALQEGLKLGNLFLENISQKGDVSWLGHLDFAAVSLKNYDLKFAKTGAIKIYLLRKGKVIDIDKRLKFDDLEPYPLKIFGNIVSGKLAEDDIVLILTEELFIPFQKLLPEIALLAPFDGKKMNEIFRKKEVVLAKISGLCLLISLSKAALPRQKEMILGNQRPAKEFAFKNIIVPGLKKIKKLIRIRKPVFKMPLPALLRKALQAGAKKRIILVLVFILFLSVGFFASQREEKEKLKIYQETFRQIQQKTNQAESYLILKDNPLLREKADSLLRENQNDISNLIKVYSRSPQSFKEQVRELENKISSELFALNKLMEIPDPELIFEINPREFIPQKIIAENNNIYLFSPYDQNLFKINENKEGSIAPTNREIDAAAGSGDMLLFFSKPNIVNIQKDGQFFETTIQVLPDYAYNNFSSYQSNLYFLDEETGQIIKYPYLGNSDWGTGRAWLFPSTKKAIGAKSISVAGSAWVLNKDNSIARYYAGQMQETLNLNIFPAPKDFSKIIALPGLSRLYLLEPQQKRVVITNRTGEIIRQFRSNKFSNLLDFSVSADGKIIYLLNGQKIYKILF